MGPKERARRAAAKRKQKEEEAAKAKQTRPTNCFTEDDIKLLVKQFKMDFPAGKISKPQTMDIINRVFPRFDADCLLKNVFEIFDNLNTGRVSNNEILWVFSMAMNGTADEKLQWLFKLYDKDSNGEIVQEEMEDIFIKMCKIVEKTELDHYKKHAKIAEEERKRKAIALEKQREKELKKARDDIYEEKNKVAVMYSEKKKRLESSKQRRNTPIKKKKKVVIKVTSLDIDEQEQESDKERAKLLKSVVGDLCQPQRDC